MHTLTPCPTADTLRLLLLGQADVESVAELEQHLSTCPRCAEAAGQVTIDDDVVTAMRRVATTEDTPVPPLTESLRPVFRRLRSGLTAQATFTWAGSPAAPPSSVHGFSELDHIGPYIVHERLGAGGMGVVYRGFDPRLERAVAIKMIRPELLAGVGVTDRFVTEARMAAAVEHDHIVPVYEVEVHDGVPCLVMPLLKGQSLEERLRTADAPLPAGEVARVAREAAAGLAAAHARGLIHRDVKPANLWLEAPRGRVKLLDFGLAVSDPTTDGIAGTPGYMAPEQIRGDRLDPRADLFGLGCVLYRAATGAGPFAAADPTATMVRTLTREAVPTAVANPVVPFPLADLIDRLLAKDPDARPVTADAVSAELDAIAAAELAQRVRTNRRRWLLGVATAAATGGLGAWLLRPEGPGPRPPVRVEFTADPDVGVLVLSSNGVDRQFNPAVDTVLSLTPGDYRVRTTNVDEGRPLVPDGFTVLPGEPRAVRLARVGSVAVSQAHDGPVSAIAVVGPDILSAGRDRTLGVWRPSEKGEPRVVRLDSPALCLAVTPNGATAATAGGDRQSPRPTIQLWDARTLVARGEPLEGHTRLVWAIGLSPDGTRMVSAAAGEVWLWDVTARTRRVLTGHGDGRVTAVAFDPSGKWILTGDDASRLVLWSVADGQPVKSLVAQAAGAIAAVRAVTFTPTGFVSAGDDGVVRVWDRSTFTARDLPARPKPVRAVAASADGRLLLTGGDDGTVTLWSATEGVVRYAFPGHRGAVTGVAFTPDGRGAVSGGQDRTVRLWRLPFD